MKLRLSAALIGGIAAIVFGQIALAADLPVRAPVYKAPPPPPPVFSWTGFYVGGNVGYAWSNSTTSYTGDADGLALVAGGALPGSYDVGDNGFTGGGQIGYNWQFAPNWVLGIEADIDALNVGKSSSASLVNPAIIELSGVAYSIDNRWDSSASLDVNWVATVRGRLGLAMDRWMVFATGGVAWADAKTNGSLSESFPSTGPSFCCRVWNGGSSGTKTGWVVGGGVEYAMTNNWLVKFEGLYYDFGHIDDVLPADPANQPINLPANLTRSTDLTITALRIGLNYKF